MPLHKLKKMSLCFALGAACSFFPSLASPQSPPKKVRAAYPGPGGGFAVTWIAKEAKLFPKYGLDAELIRISTTPRLVQAVIGGDIQFAHTGGVSTANAVTRGAELVILAQTSKGYSGHLIVKPQINSLPDLRGQKIGITQYGSTGDLYLRHGLKSWNLRPDEDVAILQLGGTAEIFAALVARRLDGAVLSTELALRARKAGFKNLYDFASLDIKEMGTSLVASRSFIEQNEATVTNFLKAFVEGIFLYKTNKDLSLRVLQKYTKNEDLELLSAVREEYITDMHAVPYPKKEDFLGSLNRLKGESKDMAKKVGGIRVEEILAVRYLREIEESGFVKELYR